MSLFPSPSAGFDAPFEMLHACHERVERMLHLLERLAAHLGKVGPDTQAQQAAADVLRYFEIAAPQHHQDEERHVLPRLRAQGQAELADRIAADHQRMHGAWLALREQLFAVQRAEDPDCSQWPAFCALYRAHIALEEAQAFPAAAAQCDAQALRAMGEEMAGRRGVRGA